MVTELKGLFIHDRQVKNEHLDNNAVDGRVVKPGSLNSSHLASESVTQSQLSSDLKGLILPDSLTYYALANATLPSGSNPFVTRQEILADRSSWRDPVNTYEDLPNSNNSTNDIRLVSTEKVLYIWKSGTWVPVESSSTATVNAVTGENEQTSSGQRNFSVFNYDIMLGQFDTYDLIHSSDRQFNRIIQIKEKINGTEVGQDSVEFLDDDSYVKTSFYTVYDTIVNVTSKQILGSSSVIWDPGIEGLLVEDQSGNNYRVESVITQDQNNYPNIIYLETPILSNYTGTVYFSNISITNNEAAIIRQKNTNEFTIMRDTDSVLNTAKKVQVLGSSLTSSTAVLSIRENDTVIINYKRKGDEEEWSQYVVNYVFGNSTEELVVKASSFHACHIITSPRSSTLMSNSSDNLGGNDMYAMAYIEAGTAKPYFIAWSHNFGEEPVFSQRIPLDPEINSNNYTYQDIHLDIKEINQTAYSDTLAGYNGSFSTEYVVGITASKLESDGTTDQIAFWLNDTAGASLMNGWSSPMSPMLTDSSEAEAPKILLTPQLSDDEVWFSGSIYWSSKNFSVWIIYRNRINSTIEAIPVSADNGNPSTYKYVFTQGAQSGAYPGDEGALVLTSFATADFISLFTDSSLDFKCTDKRNFDATVWNNHEIISIETINTISSSTKSVQKAILHGTPVVVAVNSINNSYGKCNELILQYKSPDKGSGSWSRIHQTNKYGNKIKIKSESVASRNATGKTYSPGVVNSDILHIFYVNSEANKLQVPCHIHNRFGTWINEDNNDPIVSRDYTNRFRHFSDSLEYLSYIGITDYDFDLDDIGQIDFAAFYNNNNNTSTKGLYVTNQEYKCKFAIWSSDLTATSSGPGARAGFTYFHHNNQIYIQGGYGANGNIDTSMWRLNVSENTWSLLKTNNPPPRVFHLSDVITNVAYSGTLGSQVRGTPSLTLGCGVDAPTGDDNGDAISIDPLVTGKPGAWLELRNFDSFCDRVVLTSDTGSSIPQYQAFFKYYDSIEPKDPNGSTGTELLRDAITCDVEGATNKVKSTEGYRDSIIKYELYNITTGAHGIIEDISAPDKACDGTSPNVDSAVYVQVNDLIGGSRNTLIEGDNIVIAYPGRPAYDQVVMYGGGTYDAARSNGYPDDLSGGGVTWPPDSVEIGGDINIGDSQQYRDGRTIFIANIAERRDNEFNFTFIPVMSNGSEQAPYPCVTGELVITDYTRDSVVGISQYPNFSVLNRSNAYRFETSYNGEAFLGSWYKLDPQKSSFGEPIEGLSAWRGAQIWHYGGIKPAPQGHSIFCNDYVASVSAITFGGFTKSDFRGYYGNSLLIMNMDDINLGWSVLKSVDEQAPPARAGGAIMVVNRQVESPEHDGYKQADAGGNLRSYIEFDKIDDTEQEIWISCGNSGDISSDNYNQSDALNDIWMGRIQYEKRRVHNTEILSNPIQFVPRLDNPFLATVSVKMASLSGMIVPNGIRTSDNTRNSVNENIAVADRYKNDRYNPLSIHDAGDADWIEGLYRGITADVPDWTKPVTIASKTLEVGDDEYTYEFYPNDSGLFDPDAYRPNNLKDNYLAYPPVGERRWTMLAKLGVAKSGGEGASLSNDPHTVYVAVYNNGRNSYVEFFISAEDSFSIDIANIAFSGGKYNPELSDHNGKSWFDVSTGMLNLTIRSTNGERFDQMDFIPTISRLENVRFVEATGIKWRNMSSEIGVKPFKNTWGALVSNGQSDQNIAYFGGRTHSDIVVNNVFTWNPPSTFIQNEKSIFYQLSDVDGSDDTKWISLKHANIVKDSVTAKFGETLDNVVTTGDYYSAWGTVELITDYGLHTNTALNRDKKPVIHIGFNVKPIVRDVTTDSFGYFVTPVGQGIGTNSTVLKTGLGYVEFELITKPVGFKSTSVTKPLLEGILNYKEGKISIIPTTTGGATAAFEGFTLVDSLIKIIDINYHTYEGPDNSKYEYNSSLDQYTRVIGDRVGGEHSSRISSWAYTGDASINSENFSYIKDDRAITVNFSSSNSGGITRIEGGTITAATADIVFASGIDVDEYVGQVLYIYSETLGVPTDTSNVGYYTINVTHAANTITISVGTFFSSSTNVVIEIAPNNNIQMSEILNLSNILPSIPGASDSISIPLWMIQEIEDANSQYTTDPSYITTNILTKTSGIKVFGKLEFTKTKTVPTDDNIKYWQYFVIEGSTLYLVPGSQILLNKNGTIYEYNAVADASDEKLIYVSDITETFPVGGWDLDLDLSYRGFAVASISGFTLEMSIMYYNSGIGRMDLPVEVTNPETYMQWQDTQIKVLFSFDEGVTWKKYDERSDLWVAVDPQNVIEDGMDFSDLIDIVSWSWSGWNNYAKSVERNIPYSYRGFVEGETSSIKMFVGLTTNEPALTPAVNSLIMNYFTGSFWESKSFHQEGTTGDDRAYLQVKSISPTLTRIENNHASDTRVRKLKATVMLRENT